MRTGALWYGLTSRAAWSQLFVKFVSEQPISQDMEL